MQPTAERRWHFECPDCQYDDGEHGELLNDEMIYCPLCWEDSGHLIELRRWKSGE